MATRDAMQPTAQRPKHPLSTAGPASVDAPQQAVEPGSGSAGLDGVEAKQPAPAISESAGSGVMISPFANGPGVPSRHHRRLSDPGGTAKDSLFPGASSV